MPNRIAVVGVGQTKAVSKAIGTSNSEMINEAVKAALENAQLTMKDIDAITVCQMDPFEMHYLFHQVMQEGCGGYLKPGIKVNSGGTSGGAVLLAAFDLVSSGLFDIGFKPLAYHLFPGSL